ncbi:pentapeptide repeat-containing protein [Paenibacillus lactis]|uniref:pentapeptide repeat-containing protein n=1 Tax=Paenibacillus lactis TaxID=228574 RepID=UPI0036C3A0EE
MSNAEAPPLKIIKPKLPKQLEPIRLSDAGIDDEASFQQFFCKDETLSDITAHKVLFDQMTFDSVAFERVSLRHAELTDIVFRQCDLSNVDFSEAILHRVEFHHCNW